MTAAGRGRSPRWTLPALVLGLVAALGAGLHASLEAWLGAGARTEAEARALAGLAAAGQRQALQGIPPVLAALAASAEVRGGDAEACARALRAASAGVPAYLNLGVVGPDGALACSARAVPGGGGRGVPAALAAGDASGRALAEPATGAPAVLFARRLEPDGAVLFAALDPAWLGRVAAEVPLPPGATLSLVDGAGTVLARHPESGRWAGRTLPAAPLVRLALEVRDGVREVPDLDGTRRVVAVAPVGPAGPGVTVAVGLSRGPALVTAARGLAAPAAAALAAVLGLAVTWTAARWLSATAGRAAAERAAREALTGEMARLVAQRAREVALQGELGGLLQGCLSVDEAAGVVRRVLEPFFPGEAGAMFVPGAEGGPLRLAAAWGPGRPAAELDPADCPGLLRGRAHVVDEARSGAACPHLGVPPPAAFACLPLVSRGETLGLLHLAAGGPARAGAAPPGWWSEVKQRLAATVPEQLALALANVRLRERLRQEAIRDPLTGLFNRRYMEESLDRELRRVARTGEPVGLLVVDVDHFKGFNDRFGHEGGDAVLAALGALLGTSVRGGDLACRLGGEEFVLVLPGAGPEEARRRADGIRLAVRALEVRHADRRLDPVTVSVGVAASPRHGETRDALLRAADAALYRAKGQGRDRVAVAEPDPAAGPPTPAGPSPPPAPGSGSG
jgi:diguanylate cyclase (GGDEF)-like protein